MSNSRYETLGELLEASAADSPSAPYLVQDHLEVSFSDLKHRADAISKSLLGRGYRPGDRLAIAGTNRREWVEFFLGVTQVGMILVTLNVRYRRSELQYMLSHSGARAVLTPAANQGFDLAALYGDLARELPELDEVFYFDPPEGTLGFDALLRERDSIGDELTQYRSEVGGDSPAIILFTSGTTGQPKGATITHRSIIASAQAQVDHFGTLPSDRMAGHMPFNHVGGITCTLVASLIARNTVVLMENFSPRGAIELINSQHLTVFSGVPTMFVLIMADPTFANLDTSRIRQVIAGGSNVEPRLCEEIQRSFPNATLCNLYGLSETSGSCIISPLDDTPEEISSTLGTAIGEFRLRALGADGPLAPGEEGELQVFGDCVVAGYWNDPAETAKAISSDGWLSTGDMVTIAPDGHVTLKGRKKEMFIQGGYNVYPVEVENLLTSHPKVAMAAGIGITDPVLGEVGRYYVVARGAELPSVAELDEFCRARLADYKVPREYVFVSELPLTPVGKIQKSILATSIKAPVQKAQP